MTFKDLISEVKRRATRDQGGQQFDTATKNIINTSLKRIAREGLWRPLRRETTIETVIEYTTGSGGGTFTNGSKNITVTGATFLTDNIQPGRRISLEGDSSVFRIKKITGETTLTIDKDYSGTTISGDGTYSIYPQEEYVLQPQVSHRMFLWHEEYGYPFLMTYDTNQSFYSRALNLTTTGTPELYTMWTENMVKEQLKDDTVITIVSSSSSDTSITITIFGEVSGYPDYENITLNGTTSVDGTKTFSSVERVVKSASTEGRVTVTANSGNTTVAVLPVGYTTEGIKYKKIHIYPLPTTVFPINVFYYKDCYKLVNDNDLHELGDDFDEAIILLSVSKIEAENNKTESDRTMRLYKDEINSLKKTNVDKIDWFPNLKGRRANRYAKVHPTLYYFQAGDGFGPRVY